MQSERATLRWVVPRMVGLVPRMVGVVPRTVGVVPNMGVWTLTGCPIRAVSANAHRCYTALRTPPRTARARDPPPAPRIPQGYPPPKVPNPRKVGT